MARFKSARNKALSDVRRDQVLSDLLALREKLVGDVSELEIGSVDYNALSLLIRQIVDAGKEVSGQSGWGTDSHRIGGR